MKDVSKIVVITDDKNKETRNIKDAISRQLFDAMGANSQVVEWSDSHNMNDFNVAGTYRITGQRTMTNDNVPINNAASGHSIDALLFVLDSTLSEDNTGDKYNVCITQLLILSNRVGGQEGDMFMRSAYGPTKDNITWKSWEKYQTNMEIGVMSETATHNPNDLNQILDHNRGLRNLTDNGIYSGVYLPPGFTSANDFETFVMVAINNYAMAGDAKTITQIKFALTNAGSVSFKKRTTAIGGNDWSAWEDFGGGSSGMVRTTWSNLKSLRDSKQLVPGCYYRITDFVTTVAVSNVKSANHQFDVIVVALSEDTLSEDAKATLHDGDTYFANNDLNAWQLKYCLDNDYNKFTWADKYNGKGVIYYLKDEFNNEAWYDFKNVKFYNNTYSNNISTDRYYYTFSYCTQIGSLYDGTVYTQTRGKFNNNKIGIHVINAQMYLGRNIFRNTYDSYTCEYNTLLNNCRENTFGNNCRFNILAEDCSSNNFNDDCHHNTLETGCSKNSLGMSCIYNIIMRYSYNNILRGNNKLILLGEDSDGNNIGYGCNYCNLEIDSGSRTLENMQYIKITKYNEYYDDGTNKLVPIKYPDLSTQPSILPYKFMGNYVYEKLIPWADLDNNSYSLKGFINPVCEDTAVILYVAGIDVGGTCVPMESDNLKLNGDALKDFKWVMIRYTGVEKSNNYY